MGIDARVLIQGRYHVPKTTPFSDLGDDTFISTGYYHYFQVKSVVYSDSKYLLKNMYGVSAKESTRLDLNTSEREMYLFTDYVEDPSQADKHLSKTQIDHFWEKGHESICISYVHLNHKIDVEAVIEHLRGGFGEQISNGCCVYYLSIDYCDIVIFCKNIDFGEYLRKILQFCYESQIQDKQLIKDCISFCAFGAVHARRAFEKFDIAEDQKELLRTSENEAKFTARVLLGIQNSDVAFRVCCALKNAQIEHSCIFTYGRHDVSITINTCTMKRMLYMMYLIDRLTQNEENVQILTFESCIGIEDSLPANKYANEGYGTEFYKNLTTMLKDATKKLGSIKESKEANVVKLQGIARSLSNIQKSGFGEDFTLCVYESIERFFELIDEEYRILKDLQALKDDEKVYAHLSFLLEQENDYFNALNSLINCMMHSERQFIQTTNFDAMFFFVPSKLMSFYTSFINLVARTMIGENDAKYAFQLVPALAENVAVADLVSVEDMMINIGNYNNMSTSHLLATIRDSGMAKRPYDKLLGIWINEDSLFDVAKTTCILVHEIAHYVGDDMRRRKDRKEPLFKSLIAVAVYYFLHDDENDDVIETEIFEKCVEEIQPILNTKLTLPEGEMYIEEFNDLILEVWYTVISEQCFKPMYWYFAQTKKRNAELEKLEKTVGGEFWEDLYEHNATLYRDIMARLWHKARHSVASDEYSDKKCIAQYIVSIKSVIKAFKESYADLHMILICNLNLDEYISTFILDKSTKIDSLLESTAIRLRIGCITHIMMENGLWKYEFGESMSAIRHLEQVYFENCDCSSVYSYEPFVARKLEDYLKRCFDAAKERYKDHERSKLIADVQWYRNTVSSFSSVVDAFKSIEGIKENYRRYLFEK